MRILADFDFWPSKIDHIRVFFEDIGEGETNENYIILIFNKICFIFHMKVKSIYY